MTQSGIVVPDTGPTAPVVPPKTDEGRPAWLPDNFKTPEDLAKSYKEAQAELTKLKQGAAATPEQTPAAPAADAGVEAKAGEPAKPADLTIKDKPAEDAAKDAVTNAGLNYDQFAEEFSKEGKLADESYAALEKAGIPKAVVDQFIADRVKEADALTNELITSAGGQDTFASMIQWAAENYENKEAYNKMMNSGDPAQMRIAMDALKSAYAGAGGTQTPSLEMGGSGSGAGGDVYGNDLEMVADMQKPQYRTDPAFRAAVEAKVKRTNGFR